MTSILKIGKAIKNILKDIDNVFPIVADQGTTYPFIVYRRSSLLPANTKDRYNYRELATIEIIVAAAQYSESVNLAEKVIDKMQYTRGTFNDIKIGEIALTNADEDYIEDAFIQRLTFQIEIL